MTNICVLWNTVYAARALEEIRSEGEQIAAADIARLSPLGFDHLNMLGRYNFSLPGIVRPGKLRPLRTEPLDIGPQEPHTLRIHYAARLAWSRPQCQQM